MVIICNSNPYLFAFISFCMDCYFSCTPHLSTLVIITLSHAYACIFTVLIILISLMHTLIYLSTVLIILCLLLFFLLFEMGNQHFDNWLGYDGLLTAPDQLEFSGFQHLSWPSLSLSDYPLTEGEILDAFPFMQAYPTDPLFPLQDLFEDDLHQMFEGESNGVCDGISSENDHMTMTKNKSLIIDIDSGEEKREVNKKRKERKMSNESGCNSCREEKAITFEEVSRYFYMPITQAAKELNVGLTLLKKKCRELGIPRWPHRKMKSLQTLIKNVQELGREEGEEGEVRLQCAVELLEQERKKMEEEPAMQLKEKTKRLRQACFKANYKKRRMMEMKLEAEDVQYPPLPLATASTATSTTCYFSNGLIHKYVP